MRLVFTFNTMKPERIFSFPPVVDEHSEILIMGSIPGKKSLEMQQYYAHPQNQFWKIMFELFEEDFSTDYQKKIQLLKKHRIALWDVIDSCERKGSLDSDIRNEEHNTVLQLLEKFTGIKIIFCNGKKSYHSLQKILTNNFPVKVLPSTSPAFTIPYQQKLLEWTDIKNFVS